MQLITNNYSINLLEIILFNNLLFVCIGNVCRSPMAEGYFREHLSKERPNVKVASAGLHALVGEAAVKEAQEVMRSVNIDISSHKARQLDEKMVSQADLVFVMDRSQKKEVELVFSHSRGRVFTLGNWRGFEVPDPYKDPLDSFEFCLELIQKGWQDWRKRL